jgi:nitrous oxidase accessory protein NosD
MRKREKFVRKGLVFGTIFLMVFVAFAGMPMNVGAEGTEGSTEPTPESFVEGSGTYFEITNSEYLNVALTSSENVHVYLESIPKAVCFFIAADCSATTTEIKLTGFEASKTYYKYQDNDFQEEFTTDETGSYTFIQDLSEHYIVIFETPLPNTFETTNSGATSATIIVPDDYPTIQAAVTAANSGDTVFVRAGTYYEHLTISKSLNLQGEDRDTTIINGGGSGSVVYMTANYVTISGFEITNGKYGIDLIGNWRINHITIKDVKLTSHNGVAFFAPHSGGHHLIEDCIISNNYGTSYAHQFGNSIIRNCEVFNNVGSLSVSWGSNTVVTNNKLHHNVGRGVDFDSMYYSTIEKNEIYENGCGIKLRHTSRYDTVRDNIVRHNDIGIEMESRTWVRNNKIYHNDLIENTLQAKSYHYNSWDNSYPSGGNYWSDYTDGDLYQGPGQNIPGSDGIGDTPYVIDGNNKDNYPLMKPWCNQPPEILSISGPDPVAVNTEVQMTGTFTDPDTGDTHTAIWDWGDESTSDGFVNDETDTVTGSHPYTSSGVYTVILTVTDNNDQSDSMTYQYVVVYDPEGGFVTGGGWIDSPAGAYIPGSGCPEEMVSYWKFDEGSGTIAGDSADENDGTFLAGPSWTNGKVGGALNFDGVDDYVHIPNSPSLVIADEITLEAWIYVPTGATGDRTIVNKYAAYWLKIENDILRFSLIIMGDWRSCFIPWTIVDDWAHVVGTYDGSIMKLYVNGVKVDEKSQTGTIATPAGDARIGCIDNYGVDARFFEGKIDEVAIYDRPLTLEEIEQHYNEGAGKAITPDASTVGLWHFDEGTGTTVVDSSTNNNDGTLVPSGPTWTPGKVGSALSFDGVDDYVDMVSTPNLNIDSDMTIEAWISLGELGRWQAIANKINSLWRGYTLDIDYDNKLHFWIGSPTGHNVGATGAQIMTTDRWYYVVGVFDDVNNKIKVYVDGDLDGTKDYTGYPLITSVPFRIGCGSWGIAEQFNGLIDEVAIYNRVLTPEEIQQHYQNGLDGKGYYNLEPLVGKANFGFVSKYRKGADVPTGNTEFQFKAGDLNFHSSDYEWLIVSGPMAKFKGTGTINDNGMYKFIVFASDSAISGGGDTDSFRIKIWEEDEFGNENIIYDNDVTDDGEDTLTDISGGSIVIHTSKK